MKKQCTKKTLVKHLLFTSLIASGLMVGFPQPSSAGENGVTAIDQTETVKGKVVDSNGEPIIGASIKVDGTTNGTVTDIDGNFTLTNVNGNGTIEISYIGFNTKKVAFKPGQTLNVQLSNN